MTTGRINQVRLANRAAATEVNLSRHANTGSEKNVENHELDWVADLTLSSYDAALGVCSKRIPHLSENSLPREACLTWNEAGLHQDVSTELTA